MKNAGVRTILWLGIMAALTIAAVVLWYIVSGGSQTTESLKWLQLVQTMATFLLPPILCAWIWDTNHRPMAWLKLDRTTNWRFYLLAIAIMVCAIPGTSEDLAMLLAYEKGAKLIVTVGSHSNMIDFLDKGLLGTSDEFRAFAGGLRSGRRATPS